MEVEQDEGMDISLRQEEKPELQFEDIDADDENNPQLVAEYVGDIYNYLRLRIFFIVGRGVLINIKC